MSSPKMGPEATMSKALEATQAQGPGTATAAGERRLTVNLSEKAYQDLKQSAQSTSRSMTDAIRIGIGLYKVAAEVMRENNKLVVVSSSGRPLKEIVLPS